MEDYEIIYQTPEMQIGKHLWRLQVYAHPTHGACTRYQWFNDGGFGQGRWADDEDWPTYNPNDSYGGMPKTLRKLYNQHEREIHEALVSGIRAWLARHDPTENEFRWNYVAQELNKLLAVLARLSAS